MTLTVDVGTRISDISPYDCATVTESNPYFQLTPALQSLVNVCLSHCAHDSCYDGPYHDLDLRFLSLSFAHYTAIE